MNANKPNMNRKRGNVSKPAPERIQGAFLGLAICETFARPDQPNIITPDPATSLPHEGHFADGTSMALSLAESFIALRAFDPRDQMIRYTSWYRYGHLCSGETCDYIDESVRQATLRFERDWTPFDSTGAENDLCLTRLVPVVAFGQTAAEARELCHESARVTHSGAATCEACASLGEILFHLMDNGSIPSSHAPITQLKSEAVDSALKACMSASSFAEGLAQLPKSPRTWAIYGQLAGARFGADALPEIWKASLARRQEIEILAAQLCNL